jgi:uncharacterized protein (TIGR02147 family)
MNPVYEYLDYRKYFSDYYEDRKGCCPFFSFRYWAAKMGTDASNIAKIIQKKRHASAGIIGRFMEFAGFDKRQQQYFLALVKFNKAKTDQQGRQLFEKLLAIKNVKAETVHEKQYEYYNKWYHTAVFALLYYYKFSGGKYRDLAMQLMPPITVEQAKESVALLEKLGLIYRDKDGVYRHTTELISSGEEWRSVAIHSFQEETIKLALESLRNHPRNVRDISSVSLTVSKEELRKIQELTREYRRSVLAIAKASDSPDRVYHLNIQLFPMTNVLEKTDEK